jgi:hypothetical protein
MGVAHFLQLPLLYLGLNHSLSHQFYASLLTLLAVTLLTNIIGGFTLTFSIIIPALIFSYLFHLSRHDSKGQIFWYPPGRLISILTAYVLGVGAVVFIFTVNAEYTSTFHAQVIEIAPQELKPYYSQIADKIVKLLPAITSGAILLATLMNGMLAQLFLVKTHKNKRPTPSISSIELPWWLWISLALFGVGSVILHGTSKVFCINMVFIISLSFVFEGISIIHTILAWYAPGKMFIWIFYISMILFGWPILIVVILGLFEPWFKIRERIAQKSRG